MNNEEEKKPGFNTPHETVKLTDALQQTAKSDGKTSTVRTFQSDIAGTVKTDNVSMIKMAMAEKTRQERQGSTYAEFDVKKPIKKIYVFAFIAVLLIGGAVGFVYWYFNQPAKPTLEDIVAPQEPEIVYSEIQVAVNVDGKDSLTIMQDLRKETLSKLDLGTIKRILITTGTSTVRNVQAKEFLGLIRSNAPDGFLRALEPYFVIGAYSFSPHDVFIVFKINSYDTAFPGALQWEQFMEVDLGKLFIDDIPPAPPITLATTTSTSSTENISTTTTVRTTNDTNKAVFKDKIVQNKDARVLVGPDGKIKLLYSFLDKNTLVIVSSEKGFKELITRMTTGRIRR